MTAGSGRHRSRFTIVVFILLVTLVLGARLAGVQAAETPRRGGVLLAAIAADAPSLDPHQ